MVRVYVMTTTYGRVAEEPPLELEDVDEDEVDSDDEEQEVEAMVDNDSSL